MHQARHHGLAIAASVILCTSLSACKAPFTSYRISKIDLAHRVETLPNGLRVIVVPDPHEATTTLTMRYNVGSAFDPKKEKGLAHLVEHLAFRIGDIVTDGKVASKTAGGSAPTSTAAEAGTRTITHLQFDNAWTSEDETFYYYVFVPRHLPDVVAGVARAMGDFTTEISSKVFDAEREVVRNERRESYEEPSKWRWYADLVDRFRPEEHPYRLAGIGTHATLDAITLESVRRFLDSHYHPSNAVLCVIGPVDVDGTLALVRDAFGMKPKKAPSILDDAWKTWKPERREEVVEVPGLHGAIVSLAWPIPPGSSNEARAIAFATESNNQFWYRLVREKRAAYRVNAWVDEGDYESTFFVVARTDDSDDVEGLRDAMFHEVERFTEVEWKEWFARSRRRSVYRRLYEIEHPTTRAHEMTWNLLHHGDPLAWPRDFDRALGIEHDFAATVSERLLARERAFVLIEHGPRATTKTPRSDEDTTKEVASSSSRDLHADRNVGPEEVAFTQPFDEYARWANGSAERWSRVEEFTLDNGLRCRVERVGALPLMSIRLRMNGGRLVEPRALLGVQKLMLDSGEIGNREDSSRTWRIAWDHERVASTAATDHHYKFMSHYADEAMRLIVEHVFDPRFETDDVVRERRDALGEHARDVHDVDALATRALWKHRGIRAASQRPTKATLEAISRGDIVAYHERVTYPENTLLTISSDLDTRTVRALVEKHFGAVSGTGRAPIDADAVEEDEARETRPAFVVVPVEHAAQSRIAIAIEVPGYVEWQRNADAYLLSVILDREARKLRKSLGVTYGADFSVERVGKRALLVARTKVEPSATRAAIGVLDRALHKLATQPLDAGEAALAQRTAMWGYANPHRTVGDSTWRHMVHMYEKRAIGFTREHVRYVAELRPGDIEQAAKSMLAAPSVIVVAGPVGAALDGLAKEMGRPLVRYTPDALNE